MSADQHRSRVRSFDDWLPPERRAGAERRFLSYVQLPAAPHGCVLWTGHKDRKGYGRILRSLKGEILTTSAHRLAYVMFWGPIPDGLVLDHLCKNPACVNPLHLEPVEHRTNLLRGVGIAARNAARTHCPHGHPYDAENTGFQRDGSRRCKACDRENHRKKVAS